MLFDQGLFGSSLPPRTICLTYDDGPGPETRDLAEYLHSEGIAATFFVVGQAAERQPELLHEIRRWGHLIGNHTYSHAGLVDLASAGGDVVEEVARADAVIRPFVSGPVLLRPPYGSWRRKTRPDGPEDWPTSLVAERLRGSGRFPHYVGPVMWDICAEDWECWCRGVPVEETARRHLEAVEQASRGIVLLHDSSEDPMLRPRNRAGALTMLLVPMLKARGYRFVPPSDVAEVHAAIHEAVDDGSVRARWINSWPQRRTETNYC